MNTFIRTPQLIEPSYNQFWFKSTSNKTNEEAYNFIFDLSVEGETGSTRTRLNPRPNSSDTIYSPANILESYLGFDSDETIVGVVPSSQSIRKYNIDSCESYVFYWSFYDNYNAQSINPSYSAGTLFSGATSHGYSVGDVIIINQDPGYTYEGYNGVHTIIQVPTPNMLIIDVSHVSTPVNGGTTVIYSKIPDIFCVNSNSLSINLNDFIYGECGAGNLVDAELGCFLFQYIDSSCNPLTLCATYTGTIFNFNTTYEITIDILSGINSVSGTGYTYLQLGDEKSENIYNSGTYTFYLSTSEINKTLKICSYFENLDTNVENKITLCPTKIKVANSFTGYTYNGVKSYEEYPYYSLPIGSREFLTDAPSTQKIRIDEEATLSYWNPIVFYGDAPSELLNGPFWVRINTINITGGTSEYEIINSPSYDTYTTNGIINHFGVGPVNLNNTPVSGFSFVNGTLPIVEDNIVSYTVKLINNIGDVMSEILTYELDTKCTKFDKVRFQWQNEEGQADYYTSYGLTISNLNVERSTYNKFLGYGYQVGDAGTTIFNIDANKTYTTTTDWLNEDTYNWLINIYKSPNVYATINGIKYPIVVEDTTAQYSSPNKKLKQLTFNFKLANKINTQR